MERRTFAAPIAALTLMLAAAPASAAPDFDLEIDGLIEDLDVLIEDASGLPGAFHDAAAAEDRWAEDVLAAAQAAEELARQVEATEAQVRALEQAIAALAREGRALGDERAPAGAFAARARGRR